MWASPWWSCWWTLGQRRSVVPIGKQRWFSMAFHLFSTFLGFNSLEFLIELMLHVEDLSDLKCHPSVISTWPSPLEGGGKAITAILEQQTLMAVSVERKARTFDEMCAWDELLVADFRSKMVGRGSGCVLFSPLKFVFSDLNQANYKQSFDPCGVLYTIPTAAIWTFFERGEKKKQQPVGKDEWSRSWKGLGTDLFVLVVISLESEPKHTGRCRLPISCGNRWTTARVGTACYYMEWSNLPLGLWRLFRAVHPSLHLGVSDEHGQMLVS